MRSIIQQFTNNAWFRRGKLQVQSYRSYLKDGVMVTEPTTLKTYTRKFFIHTASESEIRNAGLSEITEHTIVMHMEFPLNFSNGTPVHYEIEDESGEEHSVEGVTVSDVVIWNGNKYKLMYHGPWNLWRHWYYIAVKINQEGGAVIC